MSLKEKTIIGLFWSFVDNFANLGIKFFTGIVLARVLDPREFGINGLLTIFISVSQIFVESGFSNALIRKKDCTQKDYSTVFILNLLISFVIYSILFLSATAISSFFGEPRLKSLLRALGVVLIINAMTIVQRTILTKNLNFKLQTKISLVSAFVSGIVSVLMALKGYGVWSLVALSITGYLINSCLLWFWQRWLPGSIFSKDSFKELFGFGSKLLVSSLINTIYKNVYFLVIGKYFSTKELGYYTCANQFQSLPSSNLATVIGRVTYPILSKIQDDKQKLRINYRQIIRSTMYVTFVLMIGMAAIARPLILFLVGPNWLPSVIYLQMLCFVGMFYPLHALNLNMLNVQGRSDLFLKLEIIKTVLAVPTIFIGIFFGIKTMVVGIFVTNLIAFFLNSYWSGEMLGYSSKQQLSDILPSFILAFSVGSIVFGMNNLINLPSYALLLIDVFAGFSLTILIGEVFKLTDYIFLKNTMLGKYQTFKFRNNE